MFPKEEGKNGDDVYNEQFAIGDFCYLVEAVQGSMTTIFELIRIKSSPKIKFSLCSEPFCFISQMLFTTSNVAEKIEFLVSSIFRLD